MSEKEKQFADSILGTLNKLSDAKGSEFTEGLIAGINIGMVSSVQKTADSAERAESNTTEGACTE